MSAPRQVMGFVWGVVVDNRDPLGDGRALIRIPGMFEPHHPEWAVPLGMPGAGHPKGGSKYTPKIDAQVAVIFEEGNPESAPGFLTGPYGAVDGIPDGPPVVQEAYLAGAGKAGISAEQIMQQFYDSIAQLSEQDDPENPTTSSSAGTLDLAQAIDQVNEVDVVWEDDVFALFFTSSATDKRFVLIDKVSKSRLVFNATDGAQGKSSTIEIFANTSLAIKSNGVIDIQGQSVQIQGRRVASKPGVTTI